MADNVKAANALASLIKSQGIALANIQTSNLSISPMFSQPSRDQETAPTIAGNSVSNIVVVKPHDIPRLGGLLDKAVTAGANSVYGVGFDHTDPSALLDNARAFAVNDTGRKADISANASVARIGRLMTLTEEQGRTPIARYLPRTCMAAAAGPTPIEAGEDKLSMTVSAVCGRSVKPRSRDSLKRYEKGAPH
jgi:uncharacterized protein